MPDLEQFSMGATIGRMNRFQLPVADPRSIASTYGYAYQFDATLFAPYLRQLAEGLGARRTEGKVVAVNRDGESGDIESLTLESGETIAGDLFVDCSGFISLLIGKALGEPFQDWSHWLPCDRAVAMPCRTETALTPYTSAIAMEAGWRWRIPLQHRTGNGYVYSSSFISDDDAREALVGAVEGEAIAEPRILKFRAGRRERSWVNNCVSVGLASGFLEPLESTSIYLIQQAITYLVELFPEREISPIDRDEFNRLIDMEYDRIRDFLILHYHATTRSGMAFWDYVRTMPIPDTLADKLELFRRRGRVVKYREGVFLDASWIAVYLGQGVVPEGHDLRADAPPAESIARGNAPAARRDPRHGRSACPTIARISTATVRWRRWPEMSRSPLAVRTVIVAGGGIIGWSAAAALKRRIPALDGHGPAGAVARRRARRPDRHDAAVDPRIPQRYRHQRGRHPRPDRLQLSARHRLRRLDRCGRLCPRL